MSRFLAGNLMVAAPLIVLFLLVGCSPETRFALCKPSLTQGCKIVEVFNDQMSCSFVAAGANGKGNAWNDLVCLEVPE